MRLLTQHEAQLLAAARGLLYSITNEQIHNEELHAGYLAGKAESAENSIFDFLNSQSAYARDTQAGAVLRDREGAR